MLKPGLLPLSRWVRATVSGSCEPGEDLMTDVIDRLAVAMNAHDLDAVAGLIHEEYRSEQPAHPGRAFTGRAQMLAAGAAVGRRSCP
jgi:hypothetical protein